MTIEQIIRSITDLNSEGVDLADRRLYDESIGKHSEALELYKETNEQGILINPDYAVVSRSNIAYAIRQSTNDRVRALNSILGDYETNEKLANRVNKAFKELKDVFEEKGIENTYFGSARMLEEIGLIIRFDPLDDDIFNDLALGLEYLENSTGFYEGALDNTAREIVDEETILNRLLRTTGIAGTAALRLADISKEDIKEGYLDKALKYATKEMDKREEKGLTDGFDFINSLHTMGVVETELLHREGNFYESAKKHLEEAKDLAIKEKQLMVASVIDFRFAWLEYKKNPDQKDKINEHMSDAMKVQKNKDSKWNASVVGVLQKQVEVLGNALDRDYVKHIS